MEGKYNLTLSVKNTEEVISLQGQFREDDWDRLEDFVEYADALLRTTYIQDGMHSAFTMRWDHKLGMTFDTQLPAWDSVIVFLHKFRPLGLKSESTYFYKICNVLTKELTHPYIRNMVQQQRDVFSGKTLQTHYVIKVNDIVVNSENILYDWLNGYEYHRNKEKQVLIESLSSMLPDDIMKSIFLSLLNEKAVAIHKVTSFTKILLGQQSSFEDRIKIIN